MITGTEGCEVRATSESVRPSVKSPTNLTSPYLTGSLTGKLRRTELPRTYLTVALRGALLGPLLVYRAEPRRGVVRLISMTFPDEVYAVVHDDGDERYWFTMNSHLKDVDDDTEVGVYKLQAVKTKKAKHFLED